ncbi:hypothetical protein HMH01_13625 [Halovulum dunhuangense]|uniref:Anti-sigma factor RsiW n=1 Tax=Halovulum dunhuangense TaxID=1505036 RepID=A0A849L525_9RHOB|nr:hypothetical protein [Halovulum dunhuangense]NNU81475.1 hypothetical protein [Halovulum dunhuangense]
MARDRISLELLNAYADGELDSASAARVARAVAADPALAARLASLQDLRAAVAGLAPEPDQVPEPAPAAPRGRRLARLGAVAAVAALVLGAGLLLAPDAATDHAAGDPVAALVARHDGGLAQDMAGRAPSDWSARIVPLMAATGLTLVQEQELEDGTRHAVFTGRNGCRLSLFAQPRPADPTADGLALETRDGVLSATWQAGPAEYVLIARAMDQVRFATIASSLKAATRAERGDRTDLLAALDGARQRCLA